MKPQPVGRLRLLSALLFPTLGACTQPPSDPTDRFAWIDPGMPREKIEKYYGPPTHWVLYFEPTGFAVFSYVRLLSTSIIETPGPKPDWPVRGSCPVSTSSLL